MLSGLLAPALVAGVLAADLSAHGPRRRLARDAHLDRYAAVAHPPHTLFFDGKMYGLVSGGWLAETGGRPGAAILEGVVARLDRSDHRFLVIVRLSGHVEAGRRPPAGGPFLQLKPEAYKAHGGPVDPATWEYYERAEVTLVGLEALEGALVRGPHHRHAFQMGVGASGKSAGPGASLWFEGKVLRQPRRGPRLDAGVGDVTIDLGADGPQCVREYARTEHAFWLPGIGSRDFVFVQPGRLLEDGARSTAVLEGTIADRKDASLRFRARVELRGRLDPGVPGHPPAGSPKRELPRRFYKAYGGWPIDASTWRYYTTTEGTLVGEGALEGALLRITRRGPAFQIGFGADGKGLHYGGSGWLHVRVLRQPKSGRRLSVGYGDINVRIMRRCPPSDLCLRAPRKKPELPTLTERCFVLEGCALLAAREVRFGRHVLRPGGERNWHQGYFHVPNDTKLCVHPPACLAPGDYEIRVSDGSRTAGPVRVRLERPKRPTLRTHSELEKDDIQMIYVHPGARRGPWASLLVVSTDPRPSVLPGIVALGIGNQFRNLAFCTLSPPPNSECVAYGPYRIPGSFAGHTLWFQAAILDLAGRQTLPVPVTDVWRTRYR